MRGRHYRAAPGELTGWLALASEDWQPSYPFPSDIREPVVTSLYEAQRGLCVYCGRKLSLTTAGKSYHIEHFRPQREYDDLSTSWENVFLSCGQETEMGRPAETCGKSKDNWFDEQRIVEPEYPNCTSRFRFELTGLTNPKVVGDRAVCTMIEKLNLNHPELVRDRKEILFALDDPTENGLEFADFFEEDTGLAEGYAHVVGEVLGETIP